MPSYLMSTDTFLLVKREKIYNVVTSSHYLFLIHEENLHNLLLFLHSRAFILIVYCVRTHSLIKLKAFDMHEVCMLFVMLPRIL